MSLDLTTGPSVGISASDLVDKADATGTIRIEAVGERWGFTFDYLFLALSDSRAINLPPPLNGAFNLRTDFDLTIVEGAGIYRVAGASAHFDALFGLRSIGTETTVLATPQSGGVTQRVDGDTDVTDIFVGARYRHEFNQRWDLLFRGDYGFGDSDGTLNLLGGVGYRFNDLFGLNLGYRHMSIKFKDTVSTEPADTDITLSGPYLGFLFRF